MACHVMVGFMTRKSLMESNCIKFCKVAPLKVSIQGYIMIPSIYNVPFLYEQVSCFANLMKPEKLATCCARYMLLTFEKR